MKRSALMARLSLALEVGKSLILGEGTLVEESDNEGTLISALRAILFISISQPLNVRKLIGTIRSVRLEPKTLGEE